MLKKYGPFLAAFLVLAALFIFMENAVAPNFQSCVSQHTTSESNEKAQQKGRIILKTVVAESVCTLQLIDRHNGFFAALAAFVIAGFTFTLWQSTEKLWRASEDQLEHAKSEAMSAALKHVREEARLNEQIEILRQSAEASAEHARIAGAALTQLERPYIFIFDVKEFEFDSECAEFFVEYSVANYGKMPAIIEGAYIGFEFSDRGAPPRPSLMEDSHALMTAPILQAGEKREKIREYVPSGMTNDIVETDVSPDDPSARTPKFAPPGFNVPAGNDVFFRTIIEYRGPFSRNHSTGSLWLANYPAAGQLAQRGGDEYNYVK